GHHLLRVAIENRMGWLYYLGFDNGARSIELRSGAGSIHRTRDAEIGRQETRCTQRDEHSALLDELLQLGGAVQPHAAGDIVRFAVRAGAWKFRCLVIGDRLSTGFDIEDQRPAAAAALAGNDDHIVGRAQVALPDALLIN